MSLRSLTIFLFLIIIVFNSGCATIPSQTPVTMQQGIYHVVGSSQTLWRIAKTYNVDLQELMRINKVSDPRQLEVGQKLFIPGARMSLSVEPYRPISTETIKRLVGPRYYSQWHYITIHHSATLEGNAESFDRNHRNRKMGGLFYHFVIGNGTASDDGEVEVGWRWRKQINANRPFDIQICLVGDFNRQEVSEAQYDSLVKLINVLHRQYNISLANIRKHKDIEGKATECPGNNFPFYRLSQDLNRSKI